MPDTLDLQEILDVTYEKFRHVDDGEVASYIPELSKADPRDFAICLTTVDGQVFSAGDWDKEFTIQSICKPFAYQMALEELGREETLAHVGVEPSGEAFNSIELDPKTMRPFNPMVNAGAIAVSSLIKKDSFAAGVRNFVERMQLASGRHLKIDSAVLASESATGNRNRAIAYLMLNFGIIDEDVNHTLHQYFSQCSLLVNCRDLAMMAATMANMGTNPITREPVFNFEYIKDVYWQDHAIADTGRLYSRTGSPRCHRGHFRTSDPEAKHSADGMPDRYVQGQDNF
jgi:glutaminase